MGGGTVATLAWQVPFVPALSITVMVHIWLVVIAPVVKVPPAPVNVPVERFPSHA